MKLFYAHGAKAASRIFVSATCCASLFYGAAAIAQVCATPGKDSAIASIAGVINSYYPGTAGTLAPGAVFLPIGAIQPGGATAIAPGDLVIVMQMQGARIDSSNSDCYGDSVGTAGCTTRTTTTASYAGGNLATGYLAGNWEYCTALSAAGTSVNVTCAGTGGGTVNAYQSNASSGPLTDGNFNYQVIRVPQYTSVALAANVIPLAWNGTTGGVLGLQASGAVNLNGFNLVATGSGFRGGGQTFSGDFGPPILDPINGSTFYRAVVGSVSGGEREGSFKGEGVAGTPQLIYNGAAQVNTLVDGITGGSRGRGAPGNAGGGGNNQNAGGGGGGNGGQGGQGGGGWNDVSRPNTFQDSGGFGGDGASRAGNNLALSASRLIMGGGGGAGHVDGGGTNCNLGGWGGNGGGIVIVRAASLTGSGSLTSDGSNGFAPNVVGNCTDAAGGGGAGGTLFVSVGAGLAGRTLQTTGGAGANSSYTEHGPGGGGGGGAIYYSAGAGNPSISATGGPNALDTPTERPVSNWFSAPGNLSVLANVSPALTTACSTELSVSKTNDTTTVAAGGTTSYTVTFTNSGSTAANSASAADSPGVGLSCSVASCTASTSPTAAACPVAAQWPNLLAGGVALPTFPSKSSITFVVNCGVTATGQ